MTVPVLRVRPLNDAPVRPDGEWVVYWMIAARRTRSSFALERAVERAVELGRPLLVLEALRCGYTFASDRLHRFVIEGMAANAATLARRSVTYFPYVEGVPDAGKGLLRAVAERACVVVTDDFPAFMLPRMTAAAGRALPVRLEAVDGNCLLPLRATDRAFARAVDFRRLVQQALPDHLGNTPRADPTRSSRLATPVPVPRDILARWPAADLDALLSPGGLDSLPIDHGVPPVVGTPGGEPAARRRLARFVDGPLRTYDTDRNDPDPRREGTSGLSPYLHFGHVSTHEILREVARREDWSPEHLAPYARGQRSGWWGLSTPAEAFLDQVVTWRELGFNAAVHLPDHDRYDALPEWARRTLAEHETDRREHVISPEEFEAAATHDEIWNAAQRQLRRDGRIHGYLRMVWGKKILEWSATPRDALATMLALNDRWALDGRDPNSVSGILWCLGRYDRAWGPERPVFGKIRYMSTANTARKLDVKGYLREYGPA